MATKRIGIKILGLVQGVGFRPYVYRHACALNLNGYVQNTSAGVTIEIEGTDEQLERFLRQLQTAVPPHAYIQSLQYSYLDPLGYEGFEIRASPDGGEPSALILPDVATCPYCLSEMLDASNRRYEYPFTNCTHCGPRYSIIYGLPYDRPHTSMSGFTMCPECQSEYEEPTNRRFHAQPNACPNCGPQLALWNCCGEVLCEGTRALEEAVARLFAGQIVMVKGLSGFHLMADAANSDAVARLRQRKGHDQKPLAVMCPDIDWAERLSYVTQKERHLLMSPEAPIVLLPKKEGALLADNVAPANPFWGIILPYTPLHHLIMRRVGRPLIATSANIAEEPICIDEMDALERLSHVSDCLLVHDRPIVRHADDSIVRMIHGRPMVLRRARGYAPLPVTVDHPLADMVGCGGQLKSTIAVAKDRNVFVSQHIGDLENPLTWQTYKSVLYDFQRIYGMTEPPLACDKHPDYLTTRLAHTMSADPEPVQHHHAHIAACMAENKISGRVLGICWDGTGWGDDGTVWGGEFMTCDETGYHRVYHLRTFPLPGGEQAVREPRRTALGLLWAYARRDFAAYDDLSVLQTFTRPALKNMLRLLENGTAAPLTSSVGRLFDAVSALTGLATVNHYEGQAAQRLEFAGYDHPHPEHYPFRIGHGEVDWRPMLSAMIEDLRAGRAPGVIATAFQNTLVEMAVGVAHRVGEERVVLSGGCFQNKYLTERLIDRLQEQHYQVYWPQLVPPNDGGIALGQCVVAGSRRLAKATLPLTSHQEI
ncbi:MAG: carbamoyltransferase HypF [Candidatus Omnitrophica bacterium]|nr:carbamoyltransferase HypF [Candidatus Omnitrophota bacterium]